MKRERKHALVAVANDGAAFVIDLGVEHGEEMRSQLAFRVFNGEVFLVVAHHRDEHFFGERKILASKSPSITVGHSVRCSTVSTSGFIFAPARAGNGASGLVESLADRVPALGNVDNYLCA